MNILIPLLILFLVISSISKKKKKEEEAKRKAQQARAAQAAAQPYRQVPAGGNTNTAQPYIQSPVTGGGNAAWPYMQNPAGGDGNAAQPYRQTFTGQSGSAGSPYAESSQTQRKRAPRFPDEFGAEETRHKRHEKGKTAGQGVSTEGRMPGAMPGQAAPMISHRMNTLTETLNENVIPTVSAFSKTEGMGQSMPAAGNEGKSTEGEGTAVSYLQGNPAPQMHPAGFRRLAFDSNSVISGFVYSEILGPPKAKRRR